jgi:hypothetical protein
MQNGENLPPKNDINSMLQEKFATNWTCYVFQDLGDLQISIVFMENVLN